MKDYYKILGITLGADLMQIKKAYRQLALQYHPDKNKATNAAEKFIEITEAYEVLRDEKKRADYDFIYKKQHHKTETPIYQDTNYQNQQQTWTDFGAQKAKEYSSMNYDDFIQRVFDEIKIGSSYTPNVILILFILIGVFGMVSVLPKMDGSMGGVIFLIVIAYGIVVYFLFKRMQADYKEERRRKFNK
jgi:hypothetical protein